MAASFGTRKGDPKLDFWKIYESSADYVWLSLRRLGVPEADLEDLSHDVFIKAFRHFGSYDANRPVRPWLFGIALRVAIDHRERAQHRSRQTPSLEFERPCSPETLSPEGRFSAEEARAQLMRALDELSLDRRTVLVLHELDGHTMPEIAAITGVGESTLYSRLRLARLDLMHAVQDLFGSER